RVRSARARSPTQTAVTLLVNRDVRRAPRGRRVGGPALTAHERKVQSQMKRFVLVGAAALAASPALAGGGGAGAGAGRGGTILIGGIAGTTGAYGTTGQAVFNGTQMAVDEINANGGVLGKKLKFEPHNDGADATTSSQLFTKLISEGAVAIVGSPDTGPTTVA